MYKILRSTDPSNLADEVNSAISGGSAPIGGPFMTREGIWCQAVGPVASGELPAGSVAVADGDHITVHNSAGTAVAGTHTAEVADGALSDVKLAATIAPVADAATVPVQNSAGADIDDGTVTVAAGVVSAVKLPATVAGVADGTTFAGVTGSGTNATITVAGGVITGIALTE